MRILIPIYTAAFTISFVFSTSAFSATTTGTFNVKIAIVDNCQVISATDLDFGSQGVITSSLEQKSTIGVQCSNATSYNIGLNAGTGSGATVTTRVMTKTTGSSPLPTIGYALYSDSARTMNWGDTVGTDTVAKTGTGIQQNWTVYGRVPVPSPAPAAGNYTDSITITVTF